MRSAYVENESRARYSTRKKQEQSNPFPLHAASFSPVSTAQKKQNKQNPIDACACMHACTRARKGCTHSFSYFQTLPTRVRWTVPFCWSEPRWSIMRQSTATTSPLRSWCHVFWPWRGSEANTKWFTCPVLVAFSHSNEYEGQLRVCFVFVLCLFCFVGTGNRRRRVGQGKRKAR